MLEHYVIFQPHPGRGADLTVALDRFGADLESTLPGLLELTWGDNTNPASQGRGYTHVCLARLTSASVLAEQYWRHPAHQQLLGELDELCADRFALDCEVSRVVRGADG